MYLRDAIIAFGSNLVDGNPSDEYLAKFSVINTLFNENILVLNNLDEYSLNLDKIPAPFDDIELWEHVAYICQWINPEIPNNLFESLSLEDIEEIFSEPFKTVDLQPRKGYQTNYMQTFGYSKDSFISVARKFDTVQNPLEENMVSQEEAKFLLGFGKAPNILQEGFTGQLTPEIKEEIKLTCPLKESIKRFQVNDMVSVEINNQLHRSGDKAIVIETDINYNNMGMCNYIKVSFIDGKEYIYNSDVLIKEEIQGIKSGIALELEHILDVSNYIMKGYDFL